MCNKNSPLTPPRTRIRTRPRTRSLLHNDVVQRRPLKASSLLPARRSRTKTRRPKYLSLRLQLSKETGNDVVLTPSSEITEMTSSSRHHQLNLFPLHPENLVNDAAADDNVALLFNSDGGASSLNGLLPTATAMSEEEDSTSQAAERRRFDREYNYLSEDEDHHRQHHEFYYVNGRDQRGNRSNNNKNSMNSLVRTAMRNRERDMSEEKWISYSEVVEEVTSSSCSTEILEKKKKKIETTSSSSQQGYNSNSTNNSINSVKKLALKLDYQEILKAWSDKGSLYIQGDSPQTVPDLEDNSHGLGDGWGNLWQVPENEVGGNVSRMKEEGEAKDGWKIGQREASVLRYKQKRQSRLFAKRIRYQVRKLNAEKRPRMKGRFVKTS